MPGGLRVWRICQERHAATAFSGEGGRRYAARWNPAGVAMVYTSLSLSLAMVEVFVNLNPPADPGDLISIEATLPLDLTKVPRVEPGSLPMDWRRIRQAALQEIGEAWIASRRSLALLVPSAVVDGEWNVLINPEHPVAVEIRMQGPKPFLFDPRMFR